MKLKLIPMQELYKKIPELKESDVATIRDWMSKQPHLPELTDQEIANFLHARYFSIEATKKLIESNLTIRTHAKDLFENKDFMGDDIQMIKDVIVGFPLPKLTPEGYTVIFWKIIDSDVSKYSLKSITRLSYYPHVAEMLEKGPTNGYVILIDMDGYSFKHLLRLNPTIVHQTTLFTQEGFQVRLKGIIFFNGVAFMDKVAAIIKPFLTKEYEELFKVYSKVEDLAEFMPLEMLPCDYKGGKEDTMMNLWRKYLKYLEERRDFFLEESKTRKVNENLRQGKSILSNQLFGMEGSFKKLQID
ncbi:clavesin-1-like [Culicoides brevitarsis]|uniref:clavesin-1-like n=1 Tax=Culicoides brevitarsis TaxID=469753 RepID=UPI00307BCA87